MDKQDAILLTFFWIGAVVLLIGSDQSGSGWLIPVGLVIWIAGPVVAWMVQRVGRSI